VEAGLNHSLIAIRRDAIRLSDGTVTGDVSQPGEALEGWLATARAPDMH